MNKNIKNWLKCLKLKSIKTLNLRKTLEINKNLKLIKILKWIHIKN